MTKSVNLCMRLTEEDLKLIESVKDMVNKQGIYQATRSDIVRAAVKKYCTGYIKAGLTDKGAAD